MDPGKKPTAGGCPREFRRTCPLIRNSDRRQKLIQRQRTFLSREAHELRAHLHGLMGYTSLVLRKSRGCLPAQQEENLNKILRCAEELKGAIDRLDEFPFPEEGD